MQKHTLYKVISSAPLSHTNPQKVNKWLAWCQTRLCRTIHIGEVTSSPDNASLPMATVHRRNSLSRRLRSAAQCRASVAIPARGCACRAQYILDLQQLQHGVRRGRLALRSQDWLGCPRVSLGFERGSPTRPRVTRLPFVGLCGWVVRSLSPHIVTGLILAWWQTRLCGTIHIGEVTSSPNTLEI